MAVPDADPLPLRVAYTMEACWHRVPGGTAVAAVEVARRLVDRPDVRLLGVAGQHRRTPAEPFRPPMAIGHLPLPRPALYEAWLRLGRPHVERITGPVDVAHATALVPCPSRAPLVVTVHDLAFVHEPGRFTRQGARVMERSLEVVRRQARLVITSSAASRDDLIAHGVDSSRIRIVPLGVDATPAPADHVARVRRELRLPERFVLFVGTLEPRKNLRRLVAAMAAADGDRLPLVVAGPAGWGDAAPVDVGRADVRFVGFVSPADLPGLYAAATVFAYPSELEGFGLPVAEAMAQGAPVVTSAGRSTEEVAGGAAVLVDPLDVDSIRAGIVEAAARAGELAAAGRARAADLTWEAAAERTLAVYREAAGRD